MHSEETLCSDHKRAMEYVCLECKKGLCVHCTMHNSHQDHADQIKQLESGMVAVKEVLNYKASKMTEMINNFQDSAFSLVEAQSLEVTKEFTGLFDGLMKETDLYKFLNKWQTTYQKLEEIYDLSTNLTTNLNLYLKNTEKPEYKLPDVRVKPVHICTFDEDLGSPGEAAFLKDNSVIYLDTQSRTVTRIAIHHGILANYCLPNREEIMCLAVQGKYFYLGGNKQVMRIPVMQNTEPSEYIKLPKEQEGLDQLQVLNDGTLVMKYEHIIRSFNPETQTVKTITTMGTQTTYTFISFTGDGQTRIITKPNQNEVCVYKRGIPYYFKQSLSEPMSTLILENMFLVADHQNWRVLACDFNKEMYLGVVLSANDVKWPIGLAYKAPYLCITESHTQSNWSRVKFYKWLG